MAIVKNKTDLSFKFIGKVLNINKGTREVAVHIPQLMPTVSSESAQTMKAQTNNNVKINNAEYNNIIKIRNSMWIKPEDYDEPLPKIGSKVTIWFIDANPRLGFWSKFNPNNKYEVIDEEKYNELFKLEIDGQEVPIFESDRISFNLPKNTSIVYNNDKKLRTINLSQLENYVISNEQPNSPYSGLMWCDLNNIDLKIYDGTTFKPISSKVASTGDYNDLINKPDKPSMINLELELARKTTGNSYMEMIWTGSNVTQINYWSDSTKALKLFTKDLTYDLDNKPTIITITDEISTKALTTTITYSGSDVLSITKEVS